MIRKDTIYIIDNDPIRCEKLKIILDFIGEIGVEVSLPKLTNHGLKNPDIIILGTSEVAHYVTAQIQIIASCFPDTPIIILGATQEPVFQKNVVDTLTFPLQYAQLLNALHQCQIKKKILKKLLQNELPQKLFKNL